MVEGVVSAVGVVDCNVIVDLTGTKSNPAFTWSVYIDKIVITKL